MSYDVQLGGDITDDRTVYLTPDYSQLGLTGWNPYESAEILLSNVKIKRPDGTWATVLQVTEVHMKLPDGTWQVFT